MTPRRSRMYVSLFLALGASVAANVLLLQPRLSQRGLLVGQAQGPRGDGSLEGRQSATGLKAKSAGADRQEASKATIRAVQRELKEIGHYEGPADGIANLSTHAAVMAYESDNGLRLTGVPSDTLLKMLILGAGAAAGTPGSAAEVMRGSPAEQVTRLVQQLLAGRGYPIAAIDGRLGEDTRRAIQAFEGEQRLKPSGRISAALLAKLQRPGKAGQVAAGR